MAGWLAVGEEVAGVRAAIDVSDAAAVLLDERGVITSWTGGAERMFGYPAAEVKGRPAASLLAPDDAARVPAVVERCRRVSGWVGTLSVPRRDGRLVTVGTQIAAITAGEDWRGWLVLAVDVTGAPGWAMRRAVLEQMFTQSGVPMAVVDTDLRFVWSNPALEQIGGVSPEERLGRRLGEIQPGLDAEAIEEQMRRVLHSGEPVVDFERVGRPRSSTDRDRVHSMSFLRLEDETGHPAGVLYTVMDVTDRYRARQRLALLERASSYIGRTLEVLQTAQDLADVAVPELADLCVVDLLQTVIEGGEPAPGLPDERVQVALRRVGKQSIRPGTPESGFGIGHATNYHLDSPPIRSLLTGVSCRLPRLDPDAEEWAVPDLKVHRRPIAGPALFGELGLHSALVVPIRARGITLGLALFYRHETTEPFDEDDLKLAEEFVARAAVCVDNARRFTRERNAALTLQRALLPRALPKQNAVDVAYRYLPAPADVGGDWFDVIPLSGTRVALVVGDVVGHGLHAAATMGRLRTAVRNFSDLDLPVDEVLTHLDDLVGRLNERTEGTGEAAMVGGSCLYAVYDPTTRHCVLARAGQPPPALVLPDGTADFLDLPAGPPLGLGGLPFETLDLELPEGSQLILYTDGLVENLDRDIGSGLEKMRQVLARPHHLPEKTCQALLDALQPDQRRDDIALLVARTHALDAGQLVRWDLPDDYAEVYHLRASVARQLAEWNLDELIFTTELIVSELATNAIRYAAPPIHLRLIRDRALICEVFDSSSTSPRMRRAATTDEGGRGLFLVAQVAHRWGTRYTTNGKIIWAEQPFTPTTAH